MAPTPTAPVKTPDFDSSYGDEFDNIGKGFNSSSSIGRMNSLDNFNYNHKDLGKGYDDDFKWDGGGYNSWNQPRWQEYVSKGLNGILIVFIAIFVLNTIFYRKHDVMMWWRRRRLAAKYKRVKADAAGPDTAAELSGAEDDDLGMLEVVTASFTADKSVECVVDLGDGKGTHTCDAYDMEKLEKISELPFILADACRRSGNVELGAISLVDLYLKDRLRMQFTSAAGELKTVGKANTTTPAMIRAAKGFRVTILAQTTR